METHYKQFAIDLQRYEFVIVATGSKIGLRQAGNSFQEFDLVAPTDLSSEQIQIVASCGRDPAEHCAVGDAIFPAAARQWLRDAYTAIDPSGAQIEVVRHG